MENVVNQKKQVFDYLSKVKEERIKQENLKFSKRLSKK